jgi:peroxiredoxin
MEFYYNPDYNKPAVLECIKQASVFALLPKNRNIALLVYERLTRFYKGNPTPDFELPDITNQQNRLSKFKGKVVILSFGASWSSDYFSELLVLEKYSKNFGKKVLILNILIDTPNTVLINKHEQNKNWKLLLAENHNEILDLYNVKSVPQFFIISKGGWFIEAPSEPPSKWSVEKFEAFLKLK